MGEKIRVAAVQFFVGGDVNENLATCLRMIDEAAKHDPKLIVLPEFCNHFSLAKSKEHSYSLAVHLNDPFMNAIGEKAVQYGCYIVINCTVRRRNNAVTGTNVMFDPNGKIVATSDKQVLMGTVEINMLERATEPSPIVDTGIGKIGMYSCMDGVLNETPRCLALRGSQIMTNTLNSFALDEASLHIPVRASENKVFVVASNKIGPLLPPDVARQYTEPNGLKVEDFDGAGESQIVGPDGTVLAIAPRGQEAVVFADIDISEADDKTRPDGTDIFADRRPDLYRPIVQKPKERQYSPGADELVVGVYQPATDGETAVEEIVEAISTAAGDGVKLLVLPELFNLTVDADEDPAAAAKACDHAISSMHDVLSRLDCHVATSIITAELDGNYAHTGILIGKDGIVLRQKQLHRCGRHPWVTQLGDDIEILDLPWGRIALVVGGDAIYPEAFRLAALKDAEVVAVPTRVIEKWEIETGLVERAAENRFAVVAATRPSDAGCSLIAAPGPVFSIRERPFEGNLNYPKLTPAGAEFGLCVGTVYPSAAGIRDAAEDTDVVNGRPWWLLDPLIAPIETATS